MIPLQKVKDIIDKHDTLEKELSSGSIDPKLFAQKSKEYSNLGNIIETAKEYLNHYDLPRASLKTLRDAEDQRTHRAPAPRSRSEIPGSVRHKIPIGGSGFAGTYRDSAFNGYEYGNPIATSDDFKAMEPRVAEEGEGGIRLQQLSSRFHILFERGYSPAPWRTIPWSCNLTVSPIRSYVLPTPLSSPQSFP